MIIVDANILISALIGDRHDTRHFLFRSDLQFIAPKFLLVELFKHSPRIQTVSHLPQTEVLEQLSVLVNRIRFFNEDLISIGSWAEAYRLCRDVDEKDTPYVALTLEFNGKLWTRDTELKMGLSKKGFERFLER